MGWEVGVGTEFGNPSIEIPNGATVWCPWSKNFHVTGKLFSKTIFSKKRISTSCHLSGPFLKKIFVVLKSISFKTSRPSSPATFSHAPPTGSWLACPSTQIDLRSSADPMDVINDPWQGSHSKAKHTANVLSVEIADVCLQSKSKNKH